MVRRTAVGLWIASLRLRGNVWQRAALVAAHGGRLAGVTQSMTPKSEPKVGVAELGDKGRGVGRSMWISSLQPMPSLVI